MGIILSAAGVGGLIYLANNGFENLIMPLAIGVCAQPTKNPSRSSSMINLVKLRKPAFVLQTPG